MALGSHQLVRRYFQNPIAGVGSIQGEAKFGLLDPSPQLQLPLGFRNRSTMPTSSGRKIASSLCMQSSATFGRQCKEQVGLQKCFWVVRCKRKKAVIASVLGSDGGKEAGVLRPPCKSNLGCFLGSDVESDDESSVPPPVSSRLDHPERL